MVDAYSKRVAIKTILLAQLLVEQLDEIKDTTLYNGTIKNLSNKLEKVLHPFCRNQYDSMYSDDVQNSINVLDVIIDQLVHNSLINIEKLDTYNLYILKDKNGKKIKIKSTLSVAEFEKEYNIKLTNLASKNYDQ